MALAQPTIKIMKIHRGVQRNSKGGGRILRKIYYFREIQKRGGQRTDAPPPYSRLGSREEGIDDQTDCERRSLIEI